MRAIMNSPALARVLQTRVSLMRRLRIPLLLSLLLHLGVTARMYGEVEDAGEVEGVGPDEPDGEAYELPIEVLLNRGPFGVALYDEPPEVRPVAAVGSMEAGEPPPVETPSPPAGAPSAPAPLASAPLAEVPGGAPSAASAVAESSGIPGAEAPLTADLATPPIDLAPPEPIADIPPLPDPPLSEADRAVLAAMEQGEATLAPDADDDGAAHEVARLAPDRTRTAMRDRARAARGRPREAQKPKRPACPAPPDTLARVSETHWYIDRDIIEQYATNLSELQKLGSVWSHRGADGKLDGFKLGLSRCSVLRAGGLRSGDVVHDINGRRIHSVLQAIGAYLALRAEPELVLHVTRRGQPLTLGYTVEQPQRKVKRTATR